MGVVLMLMTIGGLIVASILLAISLFTANPWLTKFTLGGVAVWFVFYVVMLFGFSLFSTEKTLALNQAKEYCGFYLDCHMHTTVTGVRTAKTIGSVSANGMFYIINVKVFSDARNESVALHLTEPKAGVVLANGKKIERDEAAEAKLPTSSVRLDREIRNNETIEKEIVFDVSDPSPGLRLLITEGYGIDKYIEAILVDDEDSILHKRTYFKLQEQNETAGVK